MMHLEEISPRDSLLAPSNYVDGNQDFYGFLQLARYNGATATTTGLAAALDVCSPLSFETLPAPGQETDLDLYISRNIQQYGEQESNDSQYVPPACGIEGDTIPSRPRHEVSLLRSINGFQLLTEDRYD
jgi:hypothetical protein